MTPLRAGEPALALLQAADGTRLSGCRGHPVFGLRLGLDPQRRDADAGPVHHRRCGANPAGTPTPEVEGHSGKARIVYVPLKPTRRDTAAAKALDCLAAG